MIEYHGEQEWVEMFDVTSFKPEAGDYLMNLWTLRLI